MLTLALIFASSLAAQERQQPLGYDSSTVRALLTEGVAAAVKAPAAERGSLLSALGRTQLTAGDFNGAAQTLSLMTDESSTTVARILGRGEEFAFLDPSGLARRLTCGLHDAGRPADALAFARAMRPSAEREWELGHLAAMMARGSASPRVKPPVPVASTPGRWRSALELARSVTLPEARLDALLAIAEAIPDTGVGLPILQRVYADARQITLDDVDRQRSRDVILAGLAMQAERPGDVAALYARLSLPEDLHGVIAAAAVRPDGAPMVRRLAPRAIAAGRAIRDSAARDAFLTRLWQVLKRAGGRTLADSLLAETTYGAEHPVNLRKLLDSLKVQETTPVALAERALGKPDYAELRRQVERIPLNDKEASRAEAWANLARLVYSSKLDTARAYLRLAYDALMAAPRDSAAMDDRARDIAYQQFSLGMHEEGVRTLNLIHDLGDARYVVRQWGTSTFANLNARRLRMYADRVQNRTVRDAVLLRVISGYLIGPNASRANVAWRTALVDSIGTPAIRAEARRTVALDDLRAGNTRDARRSFLALLADPAADANTIVGDLVGAGGWREAIDWARGVSEPDVRSRRVLRVAESMQRMIDNRAQKGLWFSNGPDWCRDSF